MVAICDICGKKFKSQFALNGHKNMKNDAEHRAWKEKNIDANDKPEKIKSAVQYKTFSPEVLERAKELVEKEKRDEIINDYRTKVIQPMFDNGSWLDNNKLQSILAKKDEDHKLEISSITASHQWEEEALERQNKYQQIEINDLTEQNHRLNYHIGNRLDNDVIRWQEQLNHDQEVFNTEKVDFDRYKSAEQSKLDKSKSELERNQKIVAISVNSVTDREESLKNQIENFNMNKERVDNAIEEKKINVNSREHKVIELEKRFQKLVDETGKEFDQDRKRIKDFKDESEREIKNKEDKQAAEKKDDQEKISKEWEKINKTKKEQKAEGQRLQKREMRLMTNSFFNIFSPNTNNETPKTLDGTNYAANQNNQGAYSTDILPEDEKKNVYKVIAMPSPVYSSDEPSLQSGFSPTIISGDKVKTIENSSGSVTHSGHITFYMGSGNFNKK